MEGQWKLEVGLPLLDGGVRKGLLKKAVFEQGLEGWIEFRPAEF
jgi:hypothetical protein